MALEMKFHDPAACWEANAETWTRQARAGYDVFRDLLNTPAFLAMLPPVAGLEGLDVGCGEGSNTRKVAARGAKMRGIDLSPTFIRHARAVEGAEPLGIGFAVADAQALPFADAAFDFATAFMCLMDVANPERALREIYRVLRPGGFLQFSIIHPCFAPPRRKTLFDENGAARAVEIADYFQVGEQVEEWWFGATPEAERGRVKPFRVPFVHMTLGDWVGVLRRSGFAVDEIGEPAATPEAALAVPALAFTRIAPLFLHVRATKPGEAATGKERERENLLRRYFRCWVDKNADPLPELFEADAVYNESRGPRHAGLDQIANRFREWNGRASVLRWDATRLIHREETTVVEWFFQYRDEVGEVRAFDGVSAVVFSVSGKIAALREYAAKSPTFDPFAGEKIP